MQPAQFFIVALLNNTACRVRVTCTHNSVTSEWINSATTSGALNICITKQLNKQSSIKVCAVMHMNNSQWCLHNHTLPQQQQQGCMLAVQWLLCWVATPEAACNATPEQQLTMTRLPRTREVVRLNATSNPTLKRHLFQFCPNRRSDPTTSSNQPWLALTNYLATDCQSMTTLQQLD